MDLLNTRKDKKGELTSVQNFSCCHIALLFEEEKFQRHFYCFKLVAAYTQMKFSQHQHACWLNASSLIRIATFHPVLNQQGNFRISSQHIRHCATFMPSCAFL